MNCTLCSSEITSSITGELCTSCYFKAKKNATNNPSNPIVDNPVSSLERNETGEGNRETEGSISGEGLRIPVNVNLGSYPNSQGKRIEVEEVEEEVEKVEEDITKYCQSCIERGYGKNLATREWTPGYFICDSCFQPLLDNMLGYDVKRIEEAVRLVKSDLSSKDKPLLALLYDALDIPVNLQFQKSDDVLKNRNEIFNHHARALVNQDFNQIQSKIEELTVLLFQIKVAVEPLTDYVNKVKYEQRQKNNLKDSEGDTVIGTDGKKISIKSKTKLSKDEKMAKALGMSLEKYQEMQKVAREKEFKRITGSDNDGLAPMIKG